MASVVLNQTFFAIVLMHLAKKLEEVTQWRGVNCFPSIFGLFMTYFDTVLLFFELVIPPFSGLDITLCLFIGYK